MQPDYAVAVKLLHNLNLIIDVLKRIFLLHSACLLVLHEVLDASEHIFIEYFHCVVVVSFIHMR
jgi:hypothetical protein